MLSVSMTLLKTWIQTLSFSCVATLLHTVASVAPASAASFVNSLSLPADALDLSGGTTANTARLGYFSDLYYDRTNNAYYALGDRGPGGGLIDYQTRLQRFTLDVDANSGAISNFKVTDTILFTKNGKNYNGLNPGLLNGDKSVLGLSHDPEGLALAPNGNYYVSDEYGPSVYEFNPKGELVREFKVPANLVPKEATGTSNYVDGRPTITNGRQDNRGYEGIAISPDGKKLFAMLQDPLVNEGDPDGRRSNNLRIVEYSVETGESTAQYIYQLESLADINARIPAENAFGPNAQGRNIGISAIVALNDSEFLILERDNRGFGVEDPLLANPVGSKRVYKINLEGATDVSGVSLAGTNTLPAGVIPVQKELTIDVAALLEASGVVLPEKLEGLAIGPQLADGSYALILGTDNDFSVTQTGAGEQFDVCVGNGATSQVPINSSCPDGQSLIPAYLYSFKISESELGNFVPSQPIPEPTTIAGVALASAAGMWMKLNGDRA